MINEINPMMFNDPLALKTDWKQCNMLGSNFCSEKLVRTEPNRAEFRSTNGVLAMYIGFIAVGSAILILSKLSSIEAILFGLMFILIGAGLILFANKHTVFDKTTSSFFKGRKKAEKASAILSNIHAIQLIAKIVRGKKIYYCYELNLVLNNAERINIISHGNKKRIRADAHTLSEFLAVPVWDAIE
ncbi:MAG TPA: hypothetical protein VHT96_04470 [Clostridia bacterium]|nr:hypothetical protein [Clostridia bacterium]